MRSSINQIWDNPLAEQFAQALVVIDTKKGMQNFLCDVMTDKEITEMSARLEAARMLQAGKTYTEITKVTGLSSRTIARISDWMQNGAGGYTVVLQMLSAHQSHTPPARA